MIPLTVTQAAYLAREAAIIAAEDARLEQVARGREENARRAENAVAHAREEFGIELAANPENGTASADGMTFSYIIREGWCNLLVEAVCPDCGETNWKEISTLAELGDIINDGMKAKSYWHDCAPKEKKATNTPESSADPLAHFKKLNKYAAAAIDREEQTDDFGKAAIVFALLAVADEIKTLCETWANQQPG